MEPDIYAANYYEGTYLIAECIKRARAKGGDYWNGDALRQALLSGPKFDSVYGGQRGFPPHRGALQSTAPFPPRVLPKKLLRGTGWAARGTARARVRSSA